MKDRSPVYSVRELSEALDHENNVIAFWGAYRLLRDYPERISEVLELFLNSPHEYVQEAGLSQIVELNHEKFIPLIFRLFRSSSNRIKHLCAYPLALRPNDLIRSQLSAWFHELMHSEDYSRSDFHYSSLAYLKLLPENSREVLQKMEETEIDPLKSMILFQNLASHVEEDADFDNLMKHYSRLRTIYPSTEGIESLIELTEQEDLIQWIEYRMAGRYSIKDIYEKSLMLLESTVHYSERIIWEKIAELCNELSSGKEIEGADLTALFAMMKQWAELQIHNPNLNLLQNKVLWILRGFADHVQAEDIPASDKIAESEIHLVLSIPLIFHVESCFNYWLSAPEQFTHQIANYYHSALLTTEKRERILRFFFPDAPDWEIPLLKIKDPRVEILDMNHHEILWNLYNGDLIGKNVVWPTHFPNPEISAHSLRCLSRIYMANFDFYIEQKDHLSVDYALKVFQIILNKHSFELIYQNFDYLFIHHREVLFQTICYAPDFRMIEKLRQKYKKGETEIAEMLQFLSEVFICAPPEEIEEDLKNKDSSQGIFPFRLFCSACQNSFRYIFPKVYIDENRLNEHGILDNRSIWVDKSVDCKSCGNAIEIELDETQLEKLTSEIKLMHTFRLENNPNNKLSISQFQIFPFPVFQGVHYTPPEFENFVLEKIKGEETEEYKISLALKLARVFERTEHFDKIIDLLESKIGESKFRIEILTRLGYAHYKKENILKAREYLSGIREEYEEKIANEYERIYFEQAMSYLGLLDSQKKAKFRFKVIEGGK